MAQTDTTEKTIEMEGVSEKGSGKKLPGHIVIAKSDDPRARWYVVHTTSGHEARVADVERSAAAAANPNA